MIEKKPLSLKLGNYEIAEFGRIISSKSGWMMACVNLPMGVAVCIPYWRRLHNIPCVDRVERVSIKWYSIFPLIGIATGKGTNKPKFRSV
jgi:hypothetical protein